MDTRSALIIFAIMSHLLGWSNRGFDTYSLSSTFFFTETLEEKVRREHNGG